MAKRWKFKKYKRNLKKVKRTLPREIGVLVKNHFVRSFTIKGFVNVSFDPWALAKRPRNPLMVRTGNLRNSIVVRSASFRMIRVGTYSTDYASFHNRGTNKLPQRKFIWKSVRMTKSINNLIMKRTKEIFK